MPATNYKKLISLINEDESKAKTYLINFTLDLSNIKDNFALISQIVHARKTGLMEELLRKRLPSERNSSAKEPFPINLKNPDTGATALHIAVESHNLAMVYLLLEKGAKQLPNLAGNFPLHLACQAGDICIFHLLLAQEAEVNKVNNAGETALDCLLQKPPLTENTIKIVALLIQHGATNSKNAFQLMSESNDPRLLKFAAILALRLGHEEAAEKLLLRRYRLDSALNPLFVAAEYASKEFFAKLQTKNNLPLDVKDPQGATLVHYAARRRDTAEKTREMLQYFSAITKTSLEVKDNNNAQPIHYAAHANAVPAVSYLLKEKKDGLQSTDLPFLEELLDYAAQGDATEAVQYVTQDVNDQLKISKEKTITKIIQNSAIASMLAELEYTNLRSQLPEDYSRIDKLYKIAIESDALEVFVFLHELTSESNINANKNIKLLYLAAKLGAIKILSWFRDHNQLDFVTVVDNNTLFEVANDAAKEFLFPCGIQFFQQNCTIEALIKWGLSQSLKAKKSAALFANFCRAQASECYRARNFSLGNFYLDILEKFRPFDSLALRFDLLQQSELWQTMYELACHVICTEEDYSRRGKLAEDILMKLLNLQNDFCAHLPGRIRATKEIRLIHILARHEIQQNKAKAEVVIQEICQLDKNIDSLVVVIILNALTYFKTRIKSKNDFSVVKNEILVYSAVKHNRLEILKYLHEELNIPLNSATRSLINLAVFCHAAEVLPYLVSKGFRMDEIDPSDGCLPIHRAARTDNVPLLRDFIETAKNSLDKRDSAGRSAMHHAVGGNAIAALEYLESQNGLQLNGDLTLLLKALTGGKNVAALRFLMARGLAADIKDKEKFTLIYLAARDNAIDMIRFLHEELQIPLDVKAKGGLSLMHFAIRGKAIKVRDYLVTNRAAFGLSCNAGNTPLHIAARQGDQEALEWYRSQNQLDIYVANKQGETILDIAADSVREFLFKIVSEEYGKKNQKEGIAWIRATAAKSPQLKEMCCEYLKNQSHKCYDNSEFAQGQVYLNELEKLSPEGIEFHLELFRNLQLHDQRQHGLNIIADPQISDITKNKIREVFIHHLICGNFLLEDRCYAKLIELYTQHLPNYDKQNLLKYALFHHLRAVQALQLLHEMKTNDQQLQQRLYAYLTNQSNALPGSLTPKNFSKQARLVYSLFYNLGPITDIYDEELVAAIPILAPQGKTVAEKLIASSESSGILGKRTANEATIETIDSSVSKALGYDESAAPSLMQG